MSSAELNGANYSFRLNRCSSMFLTSMMQKNVSLSKQNWALPAVNYITEKLMIEYGVNLICSYVRFGRICKPHSLSS